MIHSNTPRQQENMMSMKVRMRIKMIRMKMCISLCAGSG